MIDKIIISAVLGITGWTTLYPAVPLPLTPWQLQVKAKQASVSAVCNKSKKQSKTVKELCERWGKYD
jgi:hypothetical protein